MRTLHCIICSAWLCSLSYEAASAERLSSDEIVKLLKGATVETTVGLKDWPQFMTFRPDGTAAGEREKSRRTVEDNGKWRIKKDGRFCLQWEDWRRGEEKCFFLELGKDGKTIKRIMKDGTPRRRDWVIK